MVTDVVLAEEDAQFIAFDCDVPLVGSARCGSPNVNVRVGGRRRLNVQVNSIPSKSCVKFTVHHAIENKELRTSGEICAKQMASTLWTNPDDETVDVFMTVKSVDYNAYTIRGNYIIDRP
jgi:hypothetical protein